MDEPKPEDVSELLAAAAAAAAGGQGSVDEVVAAVYQELRDLASGYLRRERDDHTLQPTALVHEAYLRLARDGDARWNDRAHFLGLAARVMRRVLVDHARGRGADKRGGRDVTVSIEDAGEVPTFRQIDLLKLDDALAGLADVDARQATVVELRFFGGLTVEETARVLDTSTATVKREWRMARAWLFRELSAE